MPVRWRPRGRTSAAGAYRQEAYRRYGTGAPYRQRRAVATRSELSHLSERRQHPDVAGTEIDNDRIIVTLDPDHPAEAVFVMIYPIVYRELLDRRCLGLIIEGTSGQEAPGRQPSALCPGQELLPARHLHPVLYTDCSVVDPECRCWLRITPFPTL